MHESILIRNALCVSSQETKIADVLIKDGLIADIGASLKHHAQETIDAKGLALLPGGIDPQVHFREPGFEWKEDLASGSRAAAAGGITSFFDMPNNKPAITTAALIAEKKKTARDKCCVNYNFFIGATTDNLDELNSVENVCGIKIFMGSSTGPLLVSNLKDLENIFANGKRLIAVHAEDEETLLANAAKYGSSTDVLTHLKIRTPEAALRATKLAVELSKKYSRRLHILHLTTKDEVDYLRYAKMEGPISAEVCPQHMLLWAPDIYERLGTYAQMNPPIRDKSHAESLWAALNDGIIDCIATDHAPHTREEKNSGYGKAPSGMPGVETSMPLLLDQVNKGRCDLTDVVRWMAETPCSLYGIKNKGRISQGFDADLVLVDMRKKKTVENGKLFTKVNWSPWHGQTLTGWPIITIVGGQIVYREGDIFPDIRGREIVIDAPWEQGSK